jgi:hypothetical protein
MARWNQKLMTLHIKRSVLYLKGKSKKIKTVDLANYLCHNIG